MNTIEFNLKEFMEGRKAYDSDGDSYVFLKETVYNGITKYGCVHNLKDNEKYQKIVSISKDGYYLDFKLFFKKKTIKLKTVYFKDKGLYFPDQIVSVNFELNDLGMLKYEKFMEDIGTTYKERTILFTTEVEVPIE